MRDVRPLAEEKHFIIVWATNDSSMFLQKNLRYTLAVPMSLGANYADDDKKTHSLSRGATQTYNTNPVAVKRSEKYGVHLLTSIQAARAKIRYFSRIFSCNQNL